MSILDQLTLTGKSKQDQFTSPEAHLRNKMVEAIDQQLAAADAMVKGETFQRRAMRWVTDASTGERVRRELPVRFRPWYWRDQSGAYFLNIRYGNRLVELKPDKPAIEVGEAENLVAVLQKVREAVLAGELDKLLKDARATGRVGRKA